MNTRVRMVQWSKGLTVSKRKVTNTVNSLGDGKQILILYLLFLKEIKLTLSQHTHITQIHDLLELSEKCFTESRCIITKF